MRTTKHMIIAAAIVSVLATSASPADADQEKGWSRVRELSSGTRVEVIHSGLKRSQGELVHATDSEIAIRGDAGSTTITRADVRRVSVSGHSRKNGILLGLAIGAGVGALVMVAAASSGDIDIRHDLVAGGGAVIGGAVGAALGAVLTGPVTIYRSAPTAATP